METVLGVAYNVILPIFVVIGLSMLVGHLFNPNPRTLSSLIIYLFSPFLVLDGMSRSDLRAEEIGQIAAVTVILTFALALLGVGVARLLRLDRKEESAFLLSIILINAGNYGLPLNEFAFGQAGLQRAMVFYVASAVMANTVGVYIASRGSASVRRSLLNVFRVPLPYAMALGLLLNFTGTALPLPVQRAVTLLGQAAVPAMLVLLGVQLRKAQVRGRLGPICVAAGMRLLVAPLIAFPLVALVGLTGVARQVTIVEASMSTAVMSGVLATEFGSDSDFTTAAIMVSTLASIVTLSVLLTIVS